MRSRLIVAAVIVMLACVPVQATDWAVYGLQMPDPEHGRTYDNAFGVEVQPRFGDGPLKPWLSVGVSQWDAEDADVTRFATFFRRTFPVERTQISGNVQAFTLGAGVIYELPISDSVRLVGEAGVRYHMMNSDVEMNVWERGLFGSSTTTVTELDYDNVTTCDLGGNIEFDLAENIAGLIGCIYSFDMNHDHVKDSGEKLPLSNGLEGTVFRAGLVIGY